MPNTSKKSAQHSDNYTVTEHTIVYMTGEHQKGPYDILCRRGANAHLGCNKQGQTISVIYVPAKYSREAQLLYL